MTSRLVYALLTLLLLGAAASPSWALAQEAEAEAEADPATDAATEAAEGGAEEAPVEEQVSFPVALGSLAPPPLPEGLLEPGNEPVKVMLQLAIDEDGDVTDAQVKESCGIEEVDNAAVDSALYLSFYPAQTSDGTAVAVTIDYPFFFLRPAPPPPMVPPARLSGMVEIKGDRDPLPAAIVELFKATPKEEFKDDPKKLERAENWDTEDEATYITETDDEGLFVIDDIKPGIYMATFGGGAYRVERFIEDLGEGVLREVLYRARPTGLNESTTVARRTADAPSRVLTQQELRKMPGAGGDPIAAMQSLPGVVRAASQVGGGFAGTNQAPIIRGAASEDSVLYMDGLPVPILLHSITNKTVTGDYILDQAYLRPAAPEARFGDLTGGVLGIETRSPKEKRVGGFVDIGIGESGAAIEGPITKKSRFYVGVRRTYYDLIIKLAFPGDSRLQLTTAPFAQDQQAIIEFDVAEFLTAHLSYIGTLDGIKVVDNGDEDQEERGLFDTRTDMHRFTLRGDFELGKNKKIKNRAGVALTLWGTEFNALDIISRKERHTTVHVFDDLNLPIFEWLQLDAGFLVEIDGIRLSENLPPLSREDTGPSTNTGQEQNVVGSSRQTRAWVGGYVGLPITPVEGITVAPEFRLDWRNDLKQVMPQFRMRAGFEPIEQVRISVAGGRYLQSPSQEELSSISGNPNLKAEGAWHLNVGVNVQPGTFLNVNLQGYAKFLDNQTVSSNSSGDAAAFADLGFDFSDPDDDDPTNGLTNAGIGRIWGTELFTRWNLFPGGRLVGWLGYGLSWAQRKDFEDEEWRFFANDRRHQLTVVLQGRFPGEVSLGARFQIQSGA
ncbi:MAG: TonB-dependent receptor, partial [Deltaproteobacteria bacterium]|nr:TonB-dependent receptor [Deltaproteobacteria bacterium]